MSKCSLPQWWHPAALAGNKSGVAYMEFALASPLLLILGLSGLEVANLALTHLRVSQITSNLADTASRIGESSPLSLKKIRESDINDAFQAVRLQMGNTPITERGRIILSSLERNADGGQWIHWQRCLGRGNYASTYGNAGDGSTGTAFLGMGEPGDKIMAPPSSAVMFVEVTYRYKPLISPIFGEPIIRSKAAFMVRDLRDLSNANNPANPAPAAAASTCDKFTL